MGIRGIVHTDYRSTWAQLATLGLVEEKGVIREPQ